MFVFLCLSALGPIYEPCYGQFLVFLANKMEEFFLAVGGQKLFLSLCQCSYSIWPKDVLCVYVYPESGISHESPWQMVPS